MISPHIHQGKPPVYWRYSSVYRTPPGVLTVSPTVLMIIPPVYWTSPVYSWYPPTVLIISPHCTHNIPQCTEHPPVYCTDIMQGETGRETGSLITNVLKFEILFQLSHSRYNLNQSLAEPVKLFLLFGLKVDREDHFQRPGLKFR